jgi:hypothetical protein
MDCNSLILRFSVNTGTQCSPETGIASGTTSIATRDRIEFIAFLFQSIGIQNQVAFLIGRKLKSLV